MYYFTNILRQFVSAWVLNGLAWLPSIQSGAMVLVEGVAFVSVLFSAPYIMLAQSRCDMVTRFSALITFGVSFLCSTGSLDSRGSAVIMVIVQVFGLIHNILTQIVPIIWPILVVVIVLAGKAIAHTFCPNHDPDPFLFAKAALVSGVYQKELEDLDGDGLDDVLGDVDENTPADSGSHGGGAPVVSLDDEIDGSDTGTGKASAASLLLVKKKEMMATPRDHLSTASVSQSSSTTSTSPMNVVIRKPFIRIRIQTLLEFDIDLRPPESSSPSSSKLVLRIPKQRIKLKRKKKTDEAPSTAAPPSSSIRMEEGKSVKVVHDEGKDDTKVLLLEEGEIAEVLEVARRCLIPVVHFICEELGPVAVLAYNKAFRDHRHASRAEMILQLRRDSDFVLKDSSEMSLSGDTLTTTLDAEGTAVDVALLMQRMAEETRDEQVATSSIDALMACSHKADKDDRRYRFYRSHLVALDAMCAAGSAMGRRCFEGWRAVNTT